MKTKFTLIALISSILILSSCSIFKKTHQASLTDMEWALSEIYQDKISESDNFNKTPFIIFISKDKTVSGNSGCNSFHGSYTLPGDEQIEISKVISTRKACIGMSVESKFLKAFEDVKKYSIDNNVLILKDEKGNSIAKFIPKAQK